MKRAVLVSGTVMALGCAGCGWYTNVPAMIHVKSVVPATVTVEFVKNVADKTVTARYTNPEITLESQPGSIGATFKDMRLAYYRAATTSIDFKNVIFAETYLKAFVRVEPSTMHEDPSKGYLEMKDIPDKRLIIGSAKFVAPLITNAILNLGDPNAASRDTLIFARVVIEGEDDAKFPYSKELFIPISFVDSVK